MLSSATKKKIDTARDMLVGKIPMPTSQVEQITLALIYKFMSDMDKKTKELGDTSGFFANGYEKYAWDHLMDRSLPARDRVLLYREALEKMALNPHIPQLFRDIFRNASLPFNDPETLKMFLEVINQFEYDHSEELGNAFEYLLQVMGSQGDAGQFRTPRHIIDFIVEVVDPKKTDKILDPACGTAGFLISAYNHLRKNGLTNDEMDQVSANFVGYDISQDMQRLSLVNMYLHHFPDPHIYEYDSLSSEDRWGDDFDVILANPPFMTPKGGIRPHNRFSVPSNRAEVLFVDYIMEHLTTNGKAGVIVPEGIIFQSQNAYKSLRKMMVDDNYLWAVVSLPSGIFQPYSGVKTSILFFDRQLAKKSDKILFVKVENDGFSLGAQRRISKNNDLPEAISLLLTYKQKLRDGGEADIAENSMTSVVEKRDVREGGYNLSGSKYEVSKAVGQSVYKTVPIKVVASIQKGSAITQKTAKSGEIPVIAGGMSFTYTNDTPNRNSNVITVSASGANAGYIWFHDYPIFASDCTTIEADTNVISSQYLFYILKNKQEYFYSLQKGGAQPHVYGKDFEDFEIPLPPLSVQQEIVEELERYQKIIDGARQVISNYEIDFDVKDSWEILKLGEVCTFKNGLNFTKSSSGQKISVVGVKDFKDRLYAPVEELDEIQIDGDLNKDFILETNDILFVRSNGNPELVGRSIIVPYTTQRISFSGFTIRARVASKQVNPLYLAYLFKTRLFRAKMKSLGRGANIRNLSQEMLNEIAVPVPTLEEQEAIVRDLELKNDVFSQFVRVADEYEAKIKSRVDKIWGK